MENGLGNHKPRGFDAFEITLGDQMRGERATLGKSLLDVQRDLRIKATYISAIENCDPSVFQTAGFIAGYVRSYARYLNMDPDECFVRFCEESGFSGVHSDLKPSSSLASKSAVLLQTPSRPTYADPIARPRIPMTPPTAGFLSSISPSALGSVAVLGLLVLGLGYGSWMVLQEVQRVQFVPVNQTPGVTQEIATLSTDPTNQQDNVVGLNQTKPIQTSNLDQLYRPQELEVPQMVARDAPIASIDAGSLGAYAEKKPDVAAPKVEPVAPRVIAQGPPPVDVVALKAAWVRVYFPDGSVIFEKVLDAGQRYRLPVDVVGAQLRAGNAGAVFVMVGDKTYGPVGKRGSVVKGVPLEQKNVTETFALATDIFDSPLAPPLNLKELNATANNTSE